MKAEDSNLKVILNSSLCVKHVTLTWAVGTKGEERTEKDRVQTSNFLSSKCVCGGDRGGGQHTGDCRPVLFPRSLRAEHFSKVTGTFELTWKQSSGQGRGCLRS